MTRSETPSVAPALCSRASCQAARCRRVLERSPSCACARTYNLSVLMPRPDATAFESVGDGTHGHTSRHQTGVMPVRNACEHFGVTIFIRILSGGKLCTRRRTIHSRLEAASTGRGQNLPPAQHESLPPPPRSSRVLHVILLVLVLVWGAQDVAVAAAAPAARSVSCPRPPSPGPAAKGGGRGCPGAGTEEGLELRGGGGQSERRGPAGLPCDSRSAARARSKPSAGLLGRERSSLQRCLYRARR